MDNRFEVQFFGRQERETLFEVEAHLVPKHTDGAGARTVGLLHPFVENALQESEILFHDFSILIARAVLTLGTVVDDT